MFDISEAASGKDTPLKIEYKVKNMRELVSNVDSVPLLVTSVVRGASADETVDIALQYRPPLPLALLSRLIKSSGSEALHATAQAAYFTVDHA